MAYYDTKEFYALKNKWYAKLKAEGFDDIESGIENTPYLSGVRGTSTIIETAKAGAAHSQVALDTALGNLGELYGMQSVREEIVLRSVGRLSTERWLCLIYLAHLIPERTIAKELGRSRVWVRGLSVDYRKACSRYAAGACWSEIESLLKLNPILPSDFWEN